MGIIIAGIVIVVIGWLAYEMIMAPLKPDDYGLTDEEIKEQYKLTKEIKEQNESEYLDT